MNEEITDFIEQCDTCIMFASNPQREVLIVHDVPESPWTEEVGCDIFTLDQTDYLRTVDYYSGYFEIDHLERKTAESVIASYHKAETTFFLLRHTQPISE